jgi:hypothetical protein
MFCPQALAKGWHVRIFREMPIEEFLETDWCIFNYVGII